MFDHEAVGFEAFDQRLRDGAVVFDEQDLHVDSLDVVRVA